MAIIEVRDLVKEFRLGEMNSLRRSAQGVFARLRGKEPPRRAILRALKRLDFEVEAGEILGIIGHNGAGKSTLLKVLSGITRPTQGWMVVRGTVAPLIEVGAGLVPDMTGRENIYVNGAILGIPKAEIRRREEQILEFAELEDFADTPMKRYSSGMKIRLGFAIATSVSADVLIVDEVLAVGDLAFQRKCFDRLEELIKREGRTVLIVSHNIRQVERLCSRVMLLDNGKIVADGGAGEVTQEFYRRSDKVVQKYQETQRGRRIRTSGEVELLAVDVIDQEGRKLSVLPAGGTLRVRVRFSVKTRLVRPEVVIGTHRTDFVYLTGSSTARLDDRPDFNSGEHEIEYVVPQLPLVAGNYGIRVAMLDRHRRLLFAGETLEIFAVAPPRWEAREAGLRAIDVPTMWRIDGALFEAPRPSDEENDKLLAGV